MLSFNTCFPISQDSTIDELIEIGKTWRRNSPHSTINDLIDAQYNCSANECHIENDTELLHFQKYKYDNSEIGGIQHTVVENNISWTTQIVGYKNVDSFWVSVQVFKESNLPLLDDHESKKPHIVKLIMKEMGIGYDGLMPVAEDPILLKQGDEYIAQKAMEDSMGCVMPTVYVSISNNNTHNINYRAIAKLLSGMAHVIVEPDVDFSFNLKSLVAEVNAYNGAIGIYWPGNKNRLYFVQRGQKTNKNKIVNDVCRVVRKSLLSQKGLKECTWLHLQEIKSKLKIQEIRLKGTSTLDEYAEAFDVELDAAKEELNKYKKEIERLNAQLYNNTMKTPLPGAPILIKGEETDLYNGEITDIVLEILNNYLRNCEIGTRRKDIIEDII